MTDLTPAESTAAKLYSLSLVAGSRADVETLKGLTPEYRALRDAAVRWARVAYWLETGQAHTPDQLAEELAKADRDMTGAGDRALPAQAAAVLEKLYG